MATFYVTSSGAGDKSGSNEANAMGAGEFFTDFAIASASDRYLVESGTYTLTGDLTGSANGAYGTEVEVFGYSDLGTLAEATGDDRPLFACASYLFRYGDSNHLRNLRFTTAHATGIYGYNGGNITVNCKAYQTGNYGAFYGGGNYDIYEGCEGYSTGSNGQGFNMAAGVSIKFLNCYAHDANYGWYSDGRGYCTYIGCIADTIAIRGIQMGSSQGSTILNCVFYTCVDGLQGTGSSQLVMNTTFDGSTSEAITWDAEPGGLLDWNNFYNNTTDRTNVTAGANDLAVDPEFTSAAGGDFSWAGGGNLEDVGKGMTLAVG